MHQNADGVSRREYSQSHDTDTDSEDYLPLLGPDFDFETNPNQSSHVSVVTARKLPQPKSRPVTTGTSESANEVLQSAQDMFSKANKHNFNYCTMTKVSVATVNQWLNACIKQSAALLHNR